MKVLKGWDYQKERKARVEEMLELEQVAAAPFCWQVSTCRTGLAFSSTEGVSLHDYRLLATRHCFALYPFHLIPDLAYITVSHHCSSEFCSLII